MTKSKMEAALQLLALMEDLSEDCYCAGWMMGLENDLWKLAEKGGAYGRGEVHPDQAQALRELRDESGGWWIWSKDEDPLGQPTFVAVPGWEPTPGPTFVDEPSPWAQ